MKCSTHSHLQQQEDVMKRNRSFVLECLAGIAIVAPISVATLMLAAAPAAATPEAAASKAGKPAATVPLQPEAVRNYGKLPMSFELNSGQIDPRIKFDSRGRGYTVSLADTEAVISTRKVADSLVTPDSAAQSKGADVAQEENSTLRMMLVGSNPHPTLTGVNEVPAKTDYFVGRDARNWHRNVPSFAKVKYESVYPGIDMVYYGNQSQLEYDFIVAPGSDPRAIRLKMANASGTSKPALAKDGDLAVPADRSEVRFHQPTIYQVRADGKHSVDGKFVVAQNSEVSFEVGDYDHTKPLIIDPATYLGGSGYDQVNAIAVSSEGVYVAGETTSVNFPGAPPRKGSRTDRDAFVALLTPDMSSIIHTTYYGGAYDDAAFAIAVGTSGVYIAGYTYSADLPMTKHSFLHDLDGAAGGESDGFIAMFSADLTTLDYATYYGGIGRDQFNSICLTPGGEVYAAGITESISLPRIAGGFQPKVKSPISGNTTLDNTFVVEFEPDLSYAVTATFLGGYLGSWNFSITSDASGDVVYVVGTTQSDDFPVTSNAQQNNSEDGGREVAQGYITALANDLSATTGSTYIGEGVNAVPRSVVVSGQYLYVAGYTKAPFLPNSYGFAQPFFGGGAIWGDGFVREYTIDLARNVASTYLGGSGDDLILGIAISGTNLYATGFTTSTNFPHAPGGTQHSSGGAEDAFVAQFSLDLKTMGQNTYLGGAGNEQALGIAVRTVANWRSPMIATDEVFIGGFTTSYCCANGLPFGGFPASSGAAQPGNGSGLYGSNRMDGFVAEYSYPVVRNVAVAAPPGGAAKP
jgi:hypothetical protein